MRRISDWVESLEAQRLVPGLTDWAQEHADMIRGFVGPFEQRTEASLRAGLLRAADDFSKFGKITVTAATYVDNAMKFLTSEAVTLAKEGEPTPATAAGGDTPKNRRVTSRRRIDIGVSPGADDRRVATADRREEPITLTDDAQSTQRPEAGSEAGSVHASAEDSKGAGVGTQTDALASEGAGQSAS